MSRKSYFSGHDGQMNGYGLTATGGICLLLFLSPFFRGLFFQADQQWALFLTAFLFALTWLWKLSRRDLTFLGKPLDWAVIALVIVYLAASFNAANPRLALAEIIKYTLYFLTYWILSQLTISRSRLNFFLQVIYLAGIGVALAGFFNAVGLVAIRDGFLNGRIYSTMQYPNALAAYLAAISFIGMGLWLDHTPVKAAGTITFLDKSIPYLYSAGNYILVLIYLASGSRGGLVVYLPVLGLFFLGLGWKKGLLAVAHFMLISLAAVAVQGKMLEALIASASPAAWLWIGLGLTAALLGQALIQFAQQMKISKKYLLIGTAFILLLLLGGGWLRFGDSLSLEKILGMGRGFNLQEYNVQERFLFWQDAMKIVADHPVLGLGGGAFEETYRHYQSSNYSSTQVHNHYLQLWAETGTIGLLIFLAVWGCYKWTVWKIYRLDKSQVSWTLVWAMFAAAMNLGLHAFLDFDLSLSAIMLLLFAMLGLTRGIQRLNAREAAPWDGQKFAQAKYFYLGGVAIVSLALMTLTVMLWQGAVHAKLASDAYKAKNIQISRAEFETASAMDPWHVAYRTSLAQINLQLGDQDKALQLMDQALLDAPFNGTVINSGIAIYLETGRVADALVLSEELALNEPFNQKAWDGMAYRYFAAGYQAWTKGDAAAAAPLLQKAVAVPGQIEARVLAVPEFFRAAWPEGIPPITASPAINLYSGAANYILEQWPQAEKQLLAAVKTVDDPEMRGEAAMWLTVLGLKRGQDISAWQAVGGKTIANFAENVRGISQLPTIAP